MSSYTGSLNIHFASCALQGSQYTRPFQIKFRAFIQEPHRNRQTYSANIFSGHINQRYSANRLVFGMRSPVAGTNAGYRV